MKFNLEEVPEALVAQAKEWREKMIESAAEANEELMNKYLENGELAESEVLEKRESKSRPGAGIVTCRTDGFNQDGKKVCTFNRTILIARRGHSVEDKVNY